MRPDAARVVGRLAEHRRGRVVLLALERDAQKVLVVLQDVELEVVLFEHADAVDVALGEVLEARRVLAELEQDAVAVERAVALAVGLELVGDLLEQALRRDQVAVAALLVAVAGGGDADVEVHERLFVHAAAQARIAEHALPRLALLARRRRLRAGDGRQHVAAGVGVLARGLAVQLVAALAADAPRLELLDARGVDRRRRRREHLGGAIERVQVEVDVAGLARAAEHAVALGDALEPLVVLEVDDVRVLQELAIEPLRFGGAPGGEQALRARQELRVRLDHAARPFTSSLRRRCRPWCAPRATASTWPACRGRAAA